MELRTEFFNFCKSFDNLVGYVIRFKRSEADALKIHSCGKLNGVADVQTDIASVGGKIYSDKNDLGVPCVAETFKLRLQFVNRF